MSDRKNRRLSPRQGGIVVSALMIGVLAGGLAAYAWSLLEMTSMQRSCLFLYAEASCPFLDAVPRNDARRAIGDPVIKGDRSLVSRKSAYADLHEPVYNGKSFSEVLSVPVKLFFFVLGIHLLVGLVLAYRAKRALETEVHLRGPRLLTVDQYNRNTKGKKGIAFEVQDVLY